MRKSPRGRKPVTRSLASLAKTCAAFDGFAKNEHRSKRIYELLSIAINQNRKAVPQPFYAMRNVAKFFNVSLDTVAQVYYRLNREGVITIVRSSQTMIAPRSHRPRFAIRGVVCMPIWLPGFLHFMDWRSSFSELEAELSRHHFVLEPIFFRHGEEIDSAFVDRVLKFNPDYVLWDSPAQTDRSTMQSITDAGVSLLTILGPNITLPGRIYRRSFTQGMARGLAAWKASGKIDRIVVPQTGKQHRQDNLTAILHGCSLPNEIKIYENPGSLPEYFKRLTTAERAGIIFGDDVFFSRLCTLVPEEMVKLFRRHRVMVLRQVTLPSLVMPTGVTVDALLFPVRRLARRIAADLSQSKGALPSTEEVFEAEWRPRTPLEDIVQINFDA